MNMSTDNWYCNRFIHIGRPIFSVNRSGASVYNPDDIWEPACTVLHSRGTAHPVCDPSRIIAARQLNALTVPWSHYFSKNCIYAQSHLLRWYKFNCNWFNHRERPIFFSASATSDNLPFLLVMIRWLRNDFSIPHAPENMSRENIHYNLFLHLDVT